MVVKINSFGLMGMDSYPVEVEGAINKGFPAFDMVGLPDEAYLPNDNLLQLIHCVATEICDGREILYQKNNESDTYILETSKGKCTYSVDKNGYILSAQINSKNFRIDFRNQYELG